MADLNWVDYVILAILLFSVLAGFARGIVKELLSVLIWVIAFIASSLFASKLAGAFTGTSAAQDASSTVGPSILALGISFVSIFLVILVLGSLLSHAISGAVESVGLGFINRFFGGIFGFGRGVLINLMFIFIIQLTSYEQESWWKESKLVHLYQPAITWLDNLVSPNFKSLKEMHNTIEKTARSLMNNIYQYRG